MKIALDVRSLEEGDQFRGIGYYMLNLVPEILKQDKTNEYHLLVYSKNNPLYKIGKKYPRAKFYLIKKPAVPPRIFWWFDQPGLVKFLSQAQPDIFHSLDYNPPFFKPKKTKIIITVHDMIPYVFPRYYQKPFDKKSELWIKFFLARRADWLVTDSEYSRQDAQKFLKFNPKKITAIPLAVDSSFKSISEAQKQKIKDEFSRGKDYLFYMGDMYGNDPRKKVDWLIEAFARLNKTKFVDFNLILAGKIGGVGNDYARYAELADDLGIKRRVIFSGFVDYQILSKLVASARGFVYPSIYEGFGLPPLQALASGVPVLSFSTTSIPEVAGDSAILVPPDKENLYKGLIKLVSKKPKNFSQKAQAQVKKFSWKKTARQTLEVYKSLSNNYI